MKKLKVVIPALIVVLALYICFKFSKPNNKSQNLKASISVLSPSK